LVAATVSDDLRGDAPRREDQKNRKMSAGPSRSGNSFARPSSSTTSSRSTSFVTTPAHAITYGARPKKWPLAVKKCLSGTRTWIPPPPQNPWAPR
jgi:hypothetical protein